MHPGATVVDVGANVGFFSLLASRLAGPDGSVAAIEALPANAEAIRANRDLNAAANLQVLQLALTDRCGRDVFLRVDEPSWSHLADRGRHPRTVDEVVVAVSTLDALIDEARVGLPDVVKIDVEGSEIAVLDGMQATIAASRPVLIIELHGTNQEILERLHAQDYLAHNLDGPTRVSQAGPIHVMAHHARG